MSTLERAPANEEEFLGALYRGGELLAVGKIVEARSFLEQAHQLAPKNEKAQNLLGLTYFKLGLFDQSSAIYERLVRENPADPTLRVNLGLVYLKTNNLDRCIKEFETATDLEPDHKKAHNYLGLALAQAGDYSKAKEHFVLAGSDQMAEKMTRALTARFESAPSAQASVLSSAPSGVAPAVVAQPTRLVSQPPSSSPNPLPPPSHSEDEIEVMSETEVIDVDVISVETQRVEERPLEVASLESPSVELSAPQPSPSAPRLDRDWGAQFGMDPDAPSPLAAPLPVTADELPMIEVDAEVAARKVWVAPLVNTWNAESGTTPPPRSTPGTSAEVSAFVGAQSPVPQMETALDPAAEDPLWNAASSAARETEQPPSIADWNVPPDPNREMDFADVAPHDTAAPTEQTWAESLPAEASWEHQIPQQQPYDMPRHDAHPVEPQAFDEREADQQMWNEPSATQHAAEVVYDQHSYETENIEGALAPQQPLEYQEPAPATAPEWTPSQEEAPQQPVEPSWVAQSLSEFAPHPLPTVPGRGYAPMEARTLVELGATTSDIEPPLAGPFHVGPHGLAVTVHGEMLTRMTNLVAIVGTVTARPENRRARGRAVDQPFGEGAAQMQRLSGHGVVHVEMISGAKFHALDLNDDSAYLREENVFGFEETIGFEHGRLTDDTIKLGLDLVHLSGDGRVLLQLNGAMKSLAVPPGSPMMVPLQRLVGWFGRVSPRLTDFAGQGAVELTGDGIALLVTPG
jgi:Flp pilus assembly protein TadD/uncharacterized protein (AIM24 family)